MENYDKMKGGIYNAGGNHLNYSKEEIANLIKEQVKYKIIISEMADKDLRHFTVNYDKNCKPWVYSQNNSTARD